MENARSLQGIMQLPKALGVDAWPIFWWITLHPLEFTCWIPDSPLTVWKQRILRSIEIKPSCTNMTFEWNSKMASILQPLGFIVHCRCPSPVGNRCIEFCNHWLAYIVNAEEHVVKSAQPRWVALMFNSFILFIWYQSLIDLKVFNGLVTNLLMVAAWVSYFNE